MSIKEICDKYGISHRQLGILMGYSGDHIQHLNTGKSLMTEDFKASLEEKEKLLAQGSINIPK